MPESSGRGLSGTGHLWLRDDRGEKYHATECWCHDSPEAVRSRCGVSGCRFVRREWGVTTTDGVSVVLAGGEEAARTFCGEGETVVYRDVHSAGWIDADTDQDGAA